MFTLDQDSMTLYFADGRNVVLYRTEDSGKIVSRSKIDTLIGIEHPGIILGKDAWGNEYILHHHYKHVVPVVDLRHNYADGEQIYYDTRPVKYSRWEIVARALALWKARVAYGLLSSNCQQFVNIAARNEHYSETLDQVADRTALMGAGTTLLGLLFGNKGMVQAGLAISGVGIAGKAINRM